MVPSLGPSPYRHPLDGWSRVGSFDRPKEAILLVLSYPPHSTAEGPVKAALVSALKCPKGHLYLKVSYWNGLKCNRGTCLQRIPSSPFGPSMGLVRLALKEVRRASCFRSALWFIRPSHLPRSACSPLLGSCAYSVHHRPQSHPRARGLGVGAGIAFPRILLRRVFGGWTDPLPSMRDARRCRVGSCVRLQMSYGPLLYQCVDYRKVRV